MDTGNRLIDFFGFNFFAGSALGLTVGTLAGSAVYNDLNKDYTTCTTVKENLEIAMDLGLQQRLPTLETSAFFDTFDEEAVERLKLVLTEDVSEQELEARVRHNIGEVRVFYENEGLGVYDKQSVGVQLTKDYVATHFDADSNQSDFYNLERTFVRVDGEQSWTRLVLKSERFGISLLQLTKPLDAKVLPLGSGEDVAGESLRGYSLKSSYEGDTLSVDVLARDFTLVANYTGAKKLGILSDGTIIKPSIWVLPDVVPEERGSPLTQGGDVVALITGNNYIGSTGMASGELYQVVEQYVHSKGKRIPE